MSAESAKPVELDEVSLDTIDEDFADIVDRLIHKEEELRRMRSRRLEDYWMAVARGDAEPPGRTSE